MSVPVPASSRDRRTRPPSRIQARSVSAPRRSSARRRDTDPHVPGVESPTVGNCNTICTRARVHHTLRLSSYCVVGAGVLVVPTEDEMLDDYTVIYGPAAERRTWSGRGKVQEMDLRRKHADYLRDMLPKFNRLRRGDGA